ncbi:MAG: hypothetical protein GY946_23355 [bacterium]|nr:hypothetical protein [bacterium]
MRRVICQSAVGILIAATSYAIGNGVTRAGGNGVTRAGGNGVTQAAPSQVLSTGDRTVRDETPDAGIKVVESVTSPVKSTPDRVAEASTPVDRFAPVTWSSDLELALSRARSDGRLVLLLVTPNADT